MARKPQRSTFKATLRLGAIAAAVVFVSGCSHLPKLSIPVYETPVAYVGFGVGGSVLDVNTAGRDFKQRGSTSMAAQITAGLSMADNWGLELRAADLGEAEFENNLKLGYQVADLSILGKASMGARAKVFGRFGLGALSDDGDFQVRQVNKSHVVIGAGVDINLSRKLAVRVEAMAHDIDASHAQLSLLYRFNPRATKAAPIAVASPKPSQTVIAQPPTQTMAPASSTSMAVVKPAEPPKTPIPAITPTPGRIETQVAPKVVKPKVVKPRVPKTDTPVANAKSDPAQNVAVDTDKDGVVDVLDACGSSVANAIVNSRGCDIFGPVAPGVVFANGSAIINAKILASLDEVVAAMKEFPAIRVVIGAYSPQSGDSASDLLLSRRRTIAVIRYMRGAGVDATRLQPDAKALVAEVGDDSLVNRIAIKRQ